MLSLPKEYFFLIFLCFFSFYGAAQCPIAFQENDKEGLKTVSGKIILPATYDYIYITNRKNLIVLCKDKKYALANGKGELITDFVYDWIEGHYSWGPLSVKKNNNYGLIDSLGNEVIPIIYQQSYRLPQGLWCAVQHSGRWGILDLKGKTIIPIVYDDLEFWNFSEGLIPVKRINRWGFIDTLNNIKIPFIYEDIQRFSEGLAAVSLTYGRWGYIDQQNKVVIPFGYEYYGGCDYEATDFKNGRAKVRVHGKPDLEGYINVKNEFVVPLKYNCIGGFEEGYARVEYGRKFGYVDTLGNEWLINEYNKLSPEWGVIKPQPKEIPYNPNVLTKKLPDNRIGSWTMEELLEEALTAFREEPKQYPQMSNLKQLCISYGIFLDGNYVYKFYSKRSQWQEFLKGTVFKIVSEEKLRRSFYNWVMPYYKKCFETMHPFHKKTYKEIAVYLKDYMNSYDLNRTVKYMEENERAFARKNYKGEADPCRKMSAFIDRLIIIHKVISVDDSKKWVNIIADEVATWE